MVDTSSSTDYVNSGLEPKTTTANGEAVSPSSDGEHSLDLGSAMADVGLTDLVDPDSAGKTNNSPKQASSSDALPSGGASAMDTAMLPLRRLSLDFDSQGDAPTRQLSSDDANSTRATAGDNSSNYTTATSASVETPMSSAFAHLTALASPSQSAAYTHVPPPHASLSVITTSVPTITKAGVVPTSSTLSAVDMSHQSGTASTFGSPTSLGGYSPSNGSPSGGGRWTITEDYTLRKAVKITGARNWKHISSQFFNSARSDVQCLHRWQKVLKPGLVKGPWTAEEDEVVKKCMTEGISKWSEIASKIDGRIGKQCRERWFNHLDPNIDKRGWSAKEDKMLIDAQAKLGNKWSQIAKLIPGRAENAVKNRWNSSMRRRATQKNLDESTLEGAVASLGGVKIVKPKKAKVVKTPATKKRANSAASSSAKARVLKPKKTKTEVPKDGSATKPKTKRKIKAGAAASKKRAAPKGKGKKRKASESEAKEAATVMTFLAMGLGSPTSVDQDIAAASMGLTSLMAARNKNKRRAVVSSKTAEARGTAKARATAVQANAANGHDSDATIDDFPSARKKKKAAGSKKKKASNASLTQPPAVMTRVTLPSGGINTPGQTPTMTSSNNNNKKQNVDSVLAAVAAPVSPVLDSLAGVSAVLQASTNGLGLRARSIPASTIRSVGSK